jgi:hypothetical protein
MENKQTAIEWFASEALKFHLNASTKTLPIAVFEVAYLQLVEQAIQMEKEQIKDAHLIGLITSLEIEATKQSEEYYNETYGK